MRPRSPARTRTPSSALESLESRLHLSATLPFASLNTPHAGATPKTPSTHSPLSPLPGANSPAPVLHATPSQKSITLQWSNKAANETGFRLQRSSNGTPFVTIATLSPNATTDLDTSAKVGTTYAYRLIAFNLSSSTAVSATVSAALITPPAPAPATNLQESTTTTSSITLTWKASASPNATYTLLRAPLAGPFQPLATLPAGTQTFTDKSLPADTTYRYELLAKNANGTSTAALVTGMTEPPPIANPSAPQVLTAASTSITLSWTESSTNVDSFQILRAIPGNPYFTAIGSVDANTHTFTDAHLFPATQYTYMIGATGYNGYEQRFSTQVTTATTAGPTDPPANLSVSNITQTGLQLSWSITNAAPAGIQIWRSTDGTNYSQIASPSTFTTYYGEWQLSPATTYWYKVAAVNAYGSAFSQPLQVTTASPPQPTAPPAAPSNFHSYVISSSSISLSWMPPLDPAAGYHIYRSTDGTNFTLVASIDTTHSGWTDTNLNDNTTYFYKVAAWNSVGESSTDPLQAATPIALPIAPDSIGFSNVANTSVTLQWSPSSQNTGYRIYRSGGGAERALLATLSADTSTWTDTGLTPLTTYTYTVTAFTTNGGESASMPLTFETPPASA